MRKSIFVVLFMAMTATCYVLDIQHRDTDWIPDDDSAVGTPSDLALPIDPNTLYSVVEESHKIKHKKAKKTEFQKYAGHMLQGVYAPAGYNWFVLRGTFTVASGCATPAPPPSAGNPRIVNQPKLVQTEYVYMGLHWTIAIFPSPCEVIITYDKSHCKGCEHIHRLVVWGDRVNTNLPCRYHDDNNMVRITCTDPPFSPQNVTDVVWGSGQLMHGDAMQDEFLKYAGNMLRGVFAPHGYNWLVGYEPFTWDEKICTGAKFHAGNLATTPQFVYTDYPYKHHIWHIVIFPNPCTIRLGRVLEGEFRFEDKIPKPTHPCDKSKKDDGWVITC